MWLNPEREKPPYKTLFLDNKKDSELVFVKCQKKYSNRLAYGVGYYYTDPTPGYSQWFCELQEGADFSTGMYEVIGWIPIPK